MNSITYTEAREKLSETINRVCEDHDPWVITKRRDKAVVMISLEDYESLVETSHLLKSPRNARRLLESIEEIEKGKGRKRKLAL
ncbi:MAG: type II toxin-antitoxin system prevent-host-death family antitoxin [Verrucomicrobia bacterium]|nr:type II toxin-antitoxin system prevent-host-death family antitoxin [Verrucomicrobiota bacterium]MDA1087728.1 type II toxin-antitoxin system prevent-host-death family antitoxin [Verrucomicrobiota bacterium]